MEISKYLVRKILKVYILRVEHVSFNWNIYYLLIQLIYFSVSSKLKPYVINDHSDHLNNLI